MDFHLHPKQSEAFLSPANELLYGGSAGGGKSHLFRVAAIAWCADIPGLQVYLFRRTFPDLFKNHMEGPSGFPALLASWSEAGLVRINQSKGQIAFANGAKIHLCHCQFPKDLQKYQGAEIHVLMIDELTQWAFEMYSFLRGRLRLGGLALPQHHRGRFPRVLCGANPGGIGHNWVKSQFVDMALPGHVRIMAPADGGMTRQFIPARLEDNPTLLANDPDYESRLEGLGDPSLVKAMRHGDWDIVAGGMFDDIWSERRAAIVIAPFEPPRQWRIDRAFDWGSTRPFSVGWWAESDGGDLRLPGGEIRSTVKGDLFRVGEWYGWNGRPNQGCRMLASEIARGIRQREIESGWKVRPGPADSAIFSVENGRSIAEDMAACGVVWRRADKRPGSRRQGWQRLRSLMKAAGSLERPGLYVFETCRHFLRTVPALPRDDRDPDDVDTLSEDHIGDETRYRIMADAAELQRVRVGGV